MGPRSSPPDGFILIELITVIILLGIIGIFTSLFVYTGIKAYLTTRQTTAGALRAQTALDRISLELREANAFPSPPVANSAITYTSDDLPGTRKIEYDAGSGTIKIAVDGTAHVLLDDIAPSSFILNWDAADLNNSGDGNLEVSGIHVGFTLNDVGKPFNVRVYPRNWIPAPP